MAHNSGAQWASQASNRQPYYSGQWQEDQQLQMDPAQYAAYQQQLKSHDNTAYFSQQQQQVMTEQAPPQFDQPYYSQDYGVPHQSEVSFPSHSRHPDDKGEGGTTVNNDEWGQRAAAPKRGLTKKVKLVRGHVRSKTVLIERV